MSQTMLAIFSITLRIKMFSVNWILKWFDWRQRGLIDYDCIISFQTQDFGKQQDKLLTQNIQR